MSRQKGYKTQYITGSEWADKKEEERGKTGQGQSLIFFSASQSVFKSVCDLVPSTDWTPRGHYQGRWKLNSKNTVSHDDVT